MADLHDDRKKEEEEFGGFEPEQEENDETFLLGENGDYPAKLPDSFSDDLPDVESVEEVPYQEPIEDISDSDELEEPESEDDEADEEPEEESEEIESEDEVSENVEEEPEDVIDDDFKKQLQKNIEESKARREANAAEDDGIEPSGELAMPIGDDADTVVNLSDIDADKPSNYNPESEAKEKVEEQSEPEIIQEPTVELEEETKEEKKKTPVWLLMLYSSVATFLLTIGAGFLFWWLMSDNNESQDIADPQKTEQVAHSDGNHTSELAHSGEQEAEDKNVMAAADSIDEEEDNWLDSMEAEMDIEAKDTVLKFKEDKALFADLEDKIDKNLEKEKPRKQTTKSKKKSEPKNSISDNKKKTDLASNNTNSKKTKPRTNSKTQSSNIDESQFSMPQPKGPAPETGIFTVQIYSSPSKIDAESWLGQLKAREIPYAMIVEKEIKGKTWYRVRYGKFETKDAARASALELGYSQSWIDRVE